MLTIPPTNLSFHLTAMTHASLRTVTQEGRFQRYRTNLTVMQALIDYLRAECCARQSASCFDTAAASYRSID